MKNIIARVRVVLQAAPTYLVAASTIVAIATEEIAQELPEGWQDNAVAIGGKVVAIIGAAVLIIRRVTPVIAEHRGLLPPPPPPNA